MMMPVTKIRGTVVETKCVDNVVATTKHGVTRLHEPLSFMVHIRHNDDDWMGFNRQGRVADAHVYNAAARVWRTRPW